MVQLIETIEALTELLDGAPRVLRIHDLNTVHDPLHAGWLAVVGEGGDLVATIAVNSPAYYHVEAAFHAEHTGDKELWETLPVRFVPDLGIWVDRRHPLAPDVLPGH